MPACLASVGQRASGKLDICAHRMAKVQEQVVVVAKKKKMMLNIRKQDGAIYERSRTSGVRGLRCHHHQLLSQRRAKAGRQASVASPLRGMMMLGVGGAAVRRGARIILAKRRGDANPHTHTHTLINAAHSTPTKPTARR